MTDDDAKAEDPPVRSPATAGRPDMNELCDKAIAQMEALPEKEVVESRKESYGVVIQENRWGGYTARVIGTLPGADGETVVQAKTVDGCLAMCYRTYLGTLTNGRVCSVEQARLRVANAEFFVATVL